MRWGKEKPRVGNMRTIKKFAWLPTRCEEGIVWLEYYECEQGYVNWFHGTHYDWRWITFKKKYAKVKK